MRKRYRGTLRPSMQAVGTKPSTGQQALVPIKKGLPEEQRDECSTHEEWPEWNIVFPFDHVSGDQANSDDGTEE